MAESTPQSTGHEISQSSRSDEIVIAVDSGRSPLIEPAVILSTELVSSNRVHEAAAMVTDTVTNDETEDEQQEAQRQRLVKTAKFSCNVALNLSIAIITAVIDNTNKSGSRSRSELILLKASAAFALLTFFAGLGLLIFVQYKDVQRIILVRLIIITVISELAGVVVLAMNIVI